jgi:AcrR family transcriptional regulator
MAETESLSTKERILDSALTLFSEQGYDATSVAQIADAVGIKAPSLYKHFAGKQEIFTALIDIMKTRFEELGKTMHLHEADILAGNVSRYEHMSEDELVSVCRRFFNFFFHDSYTSRFLKMSTLEQYKNEKLVKLYMHEYVDSMVHYQNVLFKILAKTGCVHTDDPETTAVQFYAPIFMLLSLCFADPSREQTSLDILEKHIRQFYRLFANKKKEKSIHDE